MAGQRLLTHLSQQGVEGQKRRWWRQQFALLAGQCLPCRRVQAQLAYVPHGLALVVGATGPAVTCLAGCHWRRHTRRHRRWLPQQMAATQATQATQATRHRTPEAPAPGPHLALDFHGWRHGGNNGLRCGVVLHPLTLVMVEVAAVAVTAAVVVVMVVVVVCRLWPPPPLPPPMQGSATTMRQRRVGQRHLQAASTARCRRRRQARPYRRQTQTPLPCRRFQQTPAAEAAAAVVVVVAMVVAVGLASLAPPQRLGCALTRRCKPWLHFACPPLQVAARPRLRLATPRPREVPCRFPPSLPPWHKGGPSGRRCWMHPPHRNPCLPLSLLQGRRVVSGPPLAQQGMLHAHASLTRLL